LPPPNEDSKSNPETEENSKDAGANPQPKNIIQTPINNAPMINEEDKKLLQKVKEEPTAPKDPGEAAKEIMAKQLKEQQTMDQMRLLYRDRALCYMNGRLIVPPLVQTARETIFGREYTLNSLGEFFVMYSDFHYIFNTVNFF